MASLTRHLPENLRAPPPKMLRQFSVLWTLLFCGLGIWTYLSGRSGAIAFALVSAGLVVGIAGWVKPALVRPIFVSWTAVTFPIGWVISRLILALIYYLVVTPIAVVFKLLGRDPLRRRYDPSAQTYWRPKPRAESVKAYFRQF